MKRRIYLRRKAAWERDDPEETFSVDSANSVCGSGIEEPAVDSMSQESAHGQGNNNEHISVHTEASSFTPPIQNEHVNQQNDGNNPNAGDQPDLVIPTFLANVLQQIANAPMFQPPPPPPPRVITYKTLRDNGAELFLGDRIGEPQIAWDWIEQTARVLKDLNVPIDNYPRLSSQLLRNEAYEWWKRIDESAGTPKPWTWAHFEWAFKQEYIPKRFSEEKRKEFVELEQGNMTLPEYRQKFTKLAKFAPTLVSTPTDRIEEFRTKLRPDLRSRVSVLTTVDFAEAYEIIARADSDLNACIEYLKANNAGPNTYHSTNSASKGKRPFQESSNSHFSKKGKFVQTQSMASVDRSRKRKYPACEHCGRNHPGECWLKQGLCLGCGKPGHFKKECPTNPGEPFPPAPVASQSASARPAPSQRSTAGSKPAKNQNQQQGRAPARTYAMKARTEENPDVIQGMFSLFDTIMHVLIDPGSTLSYICVHMPEKADIMKEQLEQPILVSNPLGHSMRLDHVYQDCPLIVEGHQFSANLVELPYKEFDIILGMDWLTEHRAIIDCRRRAIQLKSGEGKSIEVNKKNEEMISWRQMG
ncbi:unnamed protein product [Cuscuta campestris]|uniref:CCHC-type domain-containing protein n=1 Tax=Cuscuta campestris TaxID=132261 RepID=A0A484N730_9ASTE|nr:unnamed protein product [Cuscuta campestris]